MTFIRVTESESEYQSLENKSVLEILIDMNAEDQTVPLAVEKCIPEIASLVENLVPRMQEGGRLFYIGAGTSGRLGVVDASECPPTFGVPHDWVIGLIAGGDRAIRKAVEFAEDDDNAAWKELSDFIPDEMDTVVGIASSGTTPYVLGGLRDAQSAGLLTACICCNPNSPISQYANHKIECIVGPEYITGSTRLKSGTAQKLILNMISSSVMIRLGRVKGNKMVDMALSNQKLIDRGIKMITHLTQLDAADARERLIRLGSVRKVLEDLNRE
ncbi:MAG: N-acetylmuramic acid 6-phosphate etherase [Saprospiraceae bacterium]|nr:N-acetylmuramic acid 6-phosphate etherase [Saprospiraceae bacterium]